MFFDIKSQIDSSFPCQIFLTDQLVLNCDHGWHEFHTGNARVIYKGYNHTAYDDQSFAMIISQDPTPKYLGNFFAIIVYDDNTVQTTNDLYRGPPLFRHLTKCEVTNLTTENLKPVWANKTLVIDGNLNVTEIPYDPLINLIQTQGLSDEQIIDNIDNIISEQFETFLTKNTKPVKVFLSGGMDTTTCFVYLKKFTKKYDVIGDIHQSDFSQFMCNNSNKFSRLWAYHQMHHFSNPCVLISGGHGDETFLRSPSTANMILTTMGTDLLTEVNKNNDNYHYHYFNLPKNKKIIQDQNLDAHARILSKYRDKTVKHILTILLNDHQHWHLENTLTFTPFKDLRVADLILQGSDSLIKGQATNAAINRQLIERHDPDLLKKITKQKNKYN